MSWYFKLKEFSPHDICINKYTWNAAGPDSMTAMKSVTRCIKIISPGNFCIQSVFLLNPFFYFLFFSVQVLKHGFSCFCTISEKSWEFFGSELFCKKLTGFCDDFKMSWNLYLLKKDLQPYLTVLSCIDYGILLVYSHILSCYV